METFREQNRLMIYLVNFSGLHLKRSVQTITKSKLLLFFFAVNSKIGVTVIPIYIISSIKYLIFDEGSFALKLAVVRRLVAFFTALFKIAVFYRHRKDIEALIDLWDSSFKEEFYSENRLEKLKRNQRQNVLFLLSAWLMIFLGGLVYTVPPFFSKTKKLHHPSGIPYREQSPDYELMAIFDLLRVVAACVSTAGADIIVMVFLSLIIVQVNHLKDCLADMVSEISIDDEGRMAFRSRQKQIKTDNVSFTTSDNPETLQSLQNNCILLGTADSVSAYWNSIDEFDAKIRIWILHHQQVISFFDRVKSLFSPIASVQLIYVIFYTCFTAFHLVRATFGIDVIVTPFVASSNLVSLFILCYLGVHAEAACCDIFEDAFSHPWYLYPSKIKTSFSFIIMRGRKPLILRGISLFRINLSTFFQVIKVTYQLFAFLLQVYTE